MPGYRNAKFAYVEPRGLGLSVIFSAAIIGVESYATYEIAQWLASIPVIIVSVVAVITAASVVTLVAVLRRQRGRQHLDAPQWVVERLGAPRIPSHGAIPVRPAPVITAAPQPAIAPAIHYYLHLHAAAVGPQQDPSLTPLGIPGYFPNVGAGEGFGESTPS